MGVPGSADLMVLATAAQATSGYEIEQSLRFNKGEDQVLKFTPSSAATTRTKATISFWMKTCDVVNNGPTFIFAGDTSTWQIIEGIAANGQWRTYSRTSSNDIVSSSFLDPYHRDHSAWYHIVCVSDTTQIPSNRADQIRFYVNGVRASGPAVSNTVGGNTNFFNNVTHMIGGNSFLSGNNGDTNAHYYMAEFHAVQGQALDETDFGEFDDNGVWRPIEYTGSHGTNGFYLKFDPSATNGIGHDHSGNGNNFTAYGFTTSGTGTDVMSDTPTNNFPTLNPLYVTPPYPTQTESGTLSKGNLAITFNGVNGGRGVTFAEVPASGKWYFEAKQTSSDNTNIGLGFFGNYTASFDNAWRVVHSNGGGGFIYSFQGPESGSEPSGSVSYSSGDILGIEIDMDNSTLQYHVNGTYATKATGLSFASYAPLLMDFRRQNSSGTNNSWLFNFGQRAFEYTPTSGFNALCTANLPAPDIADGSDYFNTVLWSGTSNSTQAVTGVGFSPDLVWLKARFTNGNNIGHVLTDQVRGAGKALQSQSTGSEITNGIYGYLSSFDSDGFTLTRGSSNGAETQDSPYTYAGWCWDAGGSGSSNTAGSITSTVSANLSAGFSIVSYTGTGANATVGHGLGVAPRMMIIKNRDSSIEQWQVYHESIGNGYVVWLNSTAVQYGPYSDFWNSTSPTSTVFTVGTANGTNKSGDDLIAYCFAEVEGYSKFGSYTGNGNADGPFVYCGFRPAYVLMKSSSLVKSWHILDSVRQTYNVMGPENLANLSGAESSGPYIDFLSNGFKLRTSDDSWNGSSNTYIFAAFAENPFGGDGVSPATAR